MRFYFFKLANVGEMLLFIFIIVQGWLRNQTHTSQDANSYVFSSTIIVIGGLQTINNLTLCKLYDKGANIFTGRIVVTILLNLLFLFCLLVFGYILHMIFYNMNRHFSYSSRDLITPLSLAVITALILVIVNGLYLIIAQTPLLTQIREKFKGRNRQELEELGNA
jgi:hypothetical protein